jgi:tryptophan 2,3-dioxygenase
LGNFEALLIIVHETEILWRLRTVSEVLQSESLYVKIAFDLLKKSHDNFVTLQNCFDLMKTRAVDMLEK